MIGGIEYHEKKAVMKDIHAYVFAKIIRIFFSMRIKSTYQMQRSHVGIL